MCQQGMYDLIDTIFDFQSTVGFSPTKRYILGPYFVIPRVSLNTLNDIS